MPVVDRVDPTLLDALAARLAQSRTAALDFSHELLAHYADTGDATTQRAVDTLVDHAAEALGELSDALGAAALGIGAALGRATAQEATENVSLTGTGPGRGRFA